VHSPQGELMARLCEDERVMEQTVLMHQGWWHRSGAVNFLTRDRISDMGEQAAYYDSFCTLKPAVSLPQEPDPKVI
jgi:anaerobic selenocysteine-containing dehydrogenase